MFRFATIAVSALLFGFQAAPPQVPPQIASLLTDVEAARSFDYMAFKAEGSDLKTATDAIHMRTRIDGGGRRCLTAAEAEAQANLDAARTAPDAAAFAADRAAAEAAWARWTAFSDGILAGQPVADPPFSYVAQRVREAGEATDPLAQELLRRTARDQLLRRGWDVTGEVWSETPTQGAKSRLTNRIWQDTCRVDGENTAWLKAHVAAHGWIRISDHGEAASGAAWLLVQHADRDPDFQAEVLTLLEPLVAAEEASGGNYAYLYDRVAVGANRPQRYGSQGRCTAKNVWEPNELEEPDRVEALRAEVDIGSLAEYQAHMSGYCADFTG